MIIQKILSERKGYWITTEIYVRGKSLILGNDLEDNQIDRFLGDHHVEENKFDDFQEAEEFFKGCGLRMVKIIEPPIGVLSCLEELEPSLIARMIAK